MVSYKAVWKHYEIYVNDIFVCSCDADELTETLKEYGYYSCQRKSMKKIVFVIIGVLLIMCGCTGQGKVKGKPVSEVYGSGYGNWKEARAG